MIKYNLYFYYQEYLGKPTNPILLKLHVEGCGPAKGKTTGYSVAPKNWDPITKKVVGLPNADNINKALYAKYQAVDNLCIKKNLLGMRLTGRELGGHQVPKYADFAQQLGKDGWSADVTRVLNFCKANKDLPNEPTLAHFDNAFLRRLRSHEEEREQAHNTISVMFDKLLSLLKIAADEGLIMKEQYAAFKPIKRIDTEHIWLEEEEERRLIAHMRTFNCNDSCKEHVAVCALLLGCNTGLRISDWNKIISEQETRIYVNPNREGKYLLNLNTKKSTSNIVVPAGPLVREILSRLKGQKITLDVAKYKEYLHRALVRPSVNIKKDVTSHIGRHTFGFKAASKHQWTETQLAAVLGVGVDVVKKYFHLTGESITKQALSLEDI